MQKIARIEPFGQRENPQIDLLGDEQFEHFVRPLLAGLVAVEHEHDLIGVMLENFDVLDAQRPFPTRPRRS